MDVGDAETINELWDLVPTVDGIDRAAVLLDLGSHLVEADRLVEALGVVESAAELFDAGHDEVAAGICAQNAAGVLRRLGRNAEEIQAHRRAVDNFDRTLRADFAASARLDLAECLRRAGSGETAATLLKQTAAFLATTEGVPPHTHARCQLLLVDTLVALGRLQEATRVMVKSTGIVLHGAPVHQVARYHSTVARIGEILATERRVERLADANRVWAETSLRRARAISFALDDDAEVLAIDIRLAILRTAANDGDAIRDAEAELIGYRDQSRDEGFLAGVAHANHGVGLCRLALCDPVGAIRVSDEAEAVFEALALFAEAARSGAQAARAMAALGRHEPARRRVEHRIPILACGGDVAAEIDARLLFAELELDNASFGHALRHARTARKLAERATLPTRADAARRIIDQAPRPQPRRSRAPRP